MPSTLRRSRLERDHYRRPHGLRHSRVDPAVPRPPRRIHRVDDQADGGRRRQHPLLRPSTRGLAHRLGSRRAAERRMGGAAAADARGRRRGGVLPPPAARTLRRKRRRQPRDGHRPRAPRAQGARAPQRSAERELDRRQPRHRADDGEVRLGGPAGRMDPEDARRHGPHRVRAHRAAARLRRHVDGDDGGARRRRVGDHRREVLEHRAAPRHPRLHLRPHVGRAR